MARYASFNAIFLCFFTVIFIAQVFGCAKSRQDQPTTRFQIDDGYITLAINQEANATLTIDEYIDPVSYELHGDGILAMIATASKEPLEGHWEEVYQNSFTPRLKRLPEDLDASIVKQEILILESLDDLQCFRRLYSTESKMDAEVKGYLYQYGIGQEWVGQLIYGEQSIVARIQGKNETVRIAWFSRIHTSIRNKGKETIEFIGTIDGRLVLDGVVWADRHYVAGGSPDRLMKKIVIDYD